MIIKLYTVVCTCSLHAHGLVIHDYSVACLAFMYSCLDQAIDYKRSVCREKDVARLQAVLGQPRVMNGIEPNSTDDQGDSVPNPNPNPIRHDR